MLALSLEEAGGVGEGCAVHEAELHAAASVVDDADVAADAPVANAVEVVVEGLVSDRLGHWRCGIKDEGSQCEDQLARVGGLCVEMVGELCFGQFHLLAAIQSLACQSFMKGNRTIIVVIADTITDATQKSTAHTTIVGACRGRRRPKT